MKAASNNTLLYSGKKSLVYKQFVNSSNSFVIVKAMRNPYPTLHELVRFNNEYEVLQVLADITAVPKVIKKGVLDGHQAIYMEYFNGVRIKDLVSDKKIPIDRFLKIAAQLAHTVGCIHQKRVIHKDLSANNIIVNPHNDLVQVIDFGLASKLTLKRQYLGNPEHLEGTLPYISPEQTGRMNRVIDYRSDLYSLGVTLYELLTGQLPFNSEDPLAMVHQHMAMPAPTPAHIREDVPPVLSDILLKLLNKNAEDRYQTAFGLQIDLEQCLANLDVQGNIAHFVLGTNDFSGQFKIDEKLYGRSQEIEHLLDTFDKVARGNIEMVLVAGYSGVGKSALVNEIHKPITAQKGYFVSGKYDQYQRNVPYSAITQAFNQFAHYLLTENTLNLEQWRKKIRGAIGESGQVLIDVIPALEMVIGQQPPVTEVDEEEAILRFNKVFQDFIRVISKEEHPLAIFIDDLQWADTASLNLLKVLITDNTNQYFLIVGAYRDNEVDAAHPLIRTVQDITRNGYQVDEIKLSNLDVSHVKTLVADTLHLPKAEVSQLAQMIHQKTLGNAFFTNQFFHSLYDKEALSFDFEQNKWQWNLEKIEAENITDNVVELMAQKIQLLKSTTQNMLKLASCLGNKFSLNTLAIIQQNNISKVFASIWQAIEVGLVIPLDDNWQTLQAQISTNVHNQEAWFMFLHDRVQQAAYSLLPNKAKGTTHLKVGRLLLKSTSEDTLPERIFDIVPHLNQGRHLISSDKEILQLTSLNLTASEKAMGALAYDSALRLLNEVLEVVPLGKFWKKQHSKLFAIYNNKALCEYRLGLFEEAQADYAILQEKVVSPRQIGKVYGEAVYLHTTMNQYLEAIRLARKGLAMLEVDFPENITMEILGEGFAKVKKSLGNRQVSDLLDSENMESENIMAQFGILNMVIPPTWLAMPEGFAWSALKMVDLSQNYGNNPISSFGYAIYALLLCGQPAQYQEGLEYGELAIELNKKMPNLFVKGTIHFFFNCFVQHWKRHKSHNVALHQVAHQGCSEGGAYVYGVYNIIFYFFQPFCSQSSLDEVTTQFENFMPFVEKVNDQDVLGVLQQLLQVIKNLQGRTITPDSITNENFNEDNYLVTLEQRNYGNGLCYFYFSKLLIYYTQGAYDKALDMAQQVQPYYVYMYGLYHQSLYHFYYALTLCKLYGSASSEQQDQFDVQLNEHLAMLKNWANTCPENYEYQYLLVTAEIGRIRKQPLTIVSELYEKAITSVAKTAKVLVHRALANELYAQYWLEQSKEKVSTVFLKEASYVYHRWGASAKVALLQHTHQKQMSSLDYLLQMTQKVENGQSLSSHSSTSTYYSHTSQSNTLSLDFLSIIKASQTLAQEVKLDRLLEKMLEIVIQNAGAEKGVLVDCHNDQLKVTLDGNGKQINLFPKGVSLDKYQELPATMIRYVKRSSQPLVFEDARQEKRYANDEYIKRTQPKSVVCLPIMRQNKIKVIFYLENNLATNAFTKNRLEVLHTLSSQIAISLENALHYQQLEQKVNERTKELHTKNKNITDSIHYGLKIQQAILTNETTLQEKFQNVFIIFKPKDIVSGDFYWFSQLDRQMFLAEIDCTGHGVPGAFMSMVGNKLLNRIVNENKETDPATILDMLHQGIKQDLKQDSNEGSDGMDISLCRITYQNPQQIEVVFAGAKQDLFYSHQGNIEILRGVRSSIGGWRGKTDTFKNHKVLLQTGDHLYLSSDGYFDAPNSRRKSFTKKSFIKLLQDINLHPMHEQKERLASALKLHQGEADQRDDITVIGVKL